MQIKPINNSMFLAVFSRNEADALLGEYSNIKPESRELKTVSSWLLRIAEELYGYKLDTKKTVIEIFYKSENVILSFSKKGEKLKRINQRYVYRFENADNMLNAIFALLNPQKSAKLLRFNNKYYIISNIETPVFCEFGEYLPDSQTDIDKIYEYGELLSKNIFKEIKVP